MPRITLDCPKLRGHTLLIIQLVEAIRNADNESIVAVARVILERAEHNINNKTTKQQQNEKNKQTERVHAD